MNKSDIYNKDKETEEIIEHPMGDDDIKFYLPNAKIIKYSELSKYNNIDELLPNNKDYVFILYEDSPNKGHWTTTTKHKTGKGKPIISYFDSYGGKIDNPLNWMPKEENKKLKQDKKLLSNLLKKCPYKVEYNPIKYQGENKNEDINSCGRHATFYVKNLTDCNRDLDQYYKLMEKIKKESGNTYDQIVSHLIDKI
jgi:hypothetical protein